MRNKRGFTLIEMMIVIAIIAVLVAVMIPIMNGSTQKAAAAANASNLRSVEGELVTMMLVDPDAFGNWKAAKEQEYKDQIGYEQNVVQPALKDLENAAKEAQETFKKVEKLVDELNKTVYVGDPSVWTLENIQTSYEAEKKNHKCSLLCMLGCTLEYKKQIKTTYVNAKQASYDAETAFQDAQKESQETVSGLQGSLTNLYTYTTDSDGYITLDNGTKIEAPVAKGVDYEGVTVEEGTVMTIYLDQNTLTFTATYGEYDKTDFAALADDND